MYSFEIPHCLCCIHRNSLEVATQLLVQLLGLMLVTNTVELAEDMLMPELIQQMSEGCLFWAHHIMFD